MPLPLAEADHRTRAPRTGARCGAWTALTWGFACAVCAAAAWAGGMFLANSLFGVRTQATDLRGYLAEATFGMAAIGAAAGLVAVIAVWVMRRGNGRRSNSSPDGVRWAIGGGITGGVAGALTPLSIITFRVSLPPEASSSLAWAVTAFFAGMLAYERTKRPGATGVSWNAIAWALAPAVLVGAVWAAGLAVCQVLTRSNLARFVAEELEPETVLAVTLGGVAIGFIVASVAALLLLRDDGASTSRSWRAAVWGLWIGLATGTGSGLSVLAVVIARGALPPELSSSLGFAVAGLLAGLIAYSQSHVTADREDEEEDEEPGQPPGAGTAWVPDDSPRPVRLSARTRSILRLLPVGAVSLASLIASAVVAPSHAALALFAVGLLGLALLPVLWSQERRLAAMERRFRGRSEPEA
jgi:hypothetical protein